MKNIRFLPILTAFMFMFGMSNNCYADQYIQNLHDQMIRHLETQGYHFTHIADGWHTLKPMQAICGEVIYPLNDPHKLTVTINYNGVFRQEFAYIQTSYINYKKVPLGSLRSGSGQWVFDIPRGVYFSPHGALPNSQTKEVKSCIQNASRYASLYVSFTINPYELTTPN
jgi:hypothetical protein